MLKDLVDYLVTLGRDTRVARIIEHKGFPDRIFIRQEDGTLGEKLFESEPRRANLASFDDFTQYVRDFGFHPEIYVNREQVVAILDGDKRSERVAIDLQPSGRFGLLQSLEQRSGGFTIPEAIRLLRFRLHGEHAQGLIDKLRNLEFNRTSSGKRSLEHGRESLGRDVEELVQQRDEIPESFGVRVPVFTTDGFRSYVSEVSVGIYLDVVNELIEFRPLEDAIEVALSSVLHAIRDDLGKALDDEELSASVFMGVP